MGDQPPLWRIWLVVLVSSAGAVLAVSALAGRLDILDAVITGLLLSSLSTGVAWAIRRGTSTTRRS